MLCPRILIHVSLIFLCLPLMGGKHLQGEVRVGALREYRDLDSESEIFTVVFDHFEYGSFETHEFDRPARIVPASFANSFLALHVLAYDIEPGFAPYFPSTIERELDEFSDSEGIVIGEKGLPPDGDFLAKLFSEFYASSEVIDQKGRFNVSARSLAKGAELGLLKLERNQSAVLFVEARGGDASGVEASSSLEALSFFGYDPNAGLVLTIDSNEFNCELQFDSNARIQLMSTRYEEGRIVLRNVLSGREFYTHSMVILGLNQF